MGIAFGNYAEEDWYSHIPHERAMNYYESLIKILGIKREELPRADYKTQDAYILEKLKERLNEKNSI